MHRLFQLLITQPDLLVEHATAYAELASADASTAFNAGKQTTLWMAALLCCVSVTAILAGGSLMIWATLPESAIRLPWILPAIPLVPLAAAFACLKMLKAKVEVPAFTKVRNQITADMQMLREVSCSE